MHKTYKLSSKKLNVFAKLVEEQVLPYVKQTDQNIVVLQWIKWMNDNNCWVSYFVWFHDLAHETIPAELQ